MTKEEKELVLKDLYARLYYGVIVRVEHDYYEDEVPPYDCKLSIKNHRILDDFCKSSLSSKLIIKPYLRSLTSMTNEETKEWADNLELSVDFYGRKHLDYRGLIDFGIALEAPEDMYNN